MKTITKSQYIRTCTRYRTLLRKKPRSPKRRVLLGIIYACLIHGLWRGHQWAYDAVQEWRMREVIENV